MSLEPTILADGYGGPERLQGFIDKAKAIMAAIGRQDYRAAPSTAQKLVWRHGRDTVTLEHQLPDRIDLRMVERGKARFRFIDESNLEPPAALIPGRAIGEFAPLLLQRCINIAERGLRQYSPGLTSSELTAHPHYARALEAAQAHASFLAHSIWPGSTLSVALILPDTRRPLQVSYLYGIDTGIMPGKAWIPYLESEAEKAAAALASLVSPALKIVGAGKICSLRVERAIIHEKSKLLSNPVQILTAADTAFSAGIDIGKPYRSTQP